MVRWSPAELQALLDYLAAEGYLVLGPEPRDGAMVYGEIRDLPVGWGDTQEPGHYRLTRRNDQSRFGYNLGPATWKQFLFPPEEAIFRVCDGEFVSARKEPRKMAFIGVRGCELAAIGIQDRVFMGETTDPAYAGRRERVLLIAVNCSQAADTCFCTSTGDGPAAGPGADLVITEINADEPHYLVDAGSTAGERLLEKLGGEVAPPDAAREIDAVLAATRTQMSRRLPGEGLAEDLLGALEHPHWDDVAQRCLACGNCTLVCPTCFCSTTHEDVDAVSLDVTHLRRWDSCFTAGHSYLASGVAHDSVRSRYRQWLTHKLASWELQFGRSGCTGCGRCISWCPVGIDLTVETARIREGSS